MRQMLKEASDAKYKDIRNIRPDHTLKTTRLRTIYDLIKYLFVSSDLHITLLKKIAKKDTDSKEKDFLNLVKENNFRNK